jgi:hypothetical protein
VKVENVWVEEPQKGEPRPEAARMPRDRQQQTPGQTQQTWLDDAHGHHVAMLRTQQPLGDSTGQQTAPAGANAGAANQKRFRTGRNGREQRFGYRAPQPMNCPFAGHRRSFAFPSDPFRFVRQLRNPNMRLFDVQQV